MWFSPFRLSMTWSNPSGPFFPSSLPLCLSFPWIPLCEKAFYFRSPECSFPFCHPTILHLQFNLFNIRLKKNSIKWCTNLANAKQSNCACLISDSYLHCSGGSWRCITGYFLIPFDNFLLCYIIIFDKSSILRNYYSPCIVLWPSAFVHHSLSYCI